jgi:hypothetical protein
MRVDAAASGAVLAGGLPSDNPFGRALTDFVKERAIRPASKRNLQIYWKPSPLHRRRSDVDALEGPEEDSPAHCAT